jgi:hypothetical protein
MKNKPKANKTPKVVENISSLEESPIYLEMNQTALELENTKAELETAKQQTNQMQAIAQEALNRLVTIETRLSPQALRKPNLMTIIFHWKELMLTIAEIVSLIKEFKDLIQKQPQNDAPK